MGDSEITLARNYEVGAAGQLAMDSLPLTARRSHSIARSRWHFSSPGGTPTR
jgi:hypothetical protein